MKIMILLLVFAILIVGCYPAKEYDENVWCDWIRLNKYDKVCEFTLPSGTRCVAYDGGSYAGGLSCDWRD